MKKILAVLLSLLLIVSVSGCKSDEKVTTPEESAESQSQQTETETGAFVEFEKYSGSWEGAVGTSGDYILSLDVLPLEGSLVLDFFYDEYAGYSAAAFTDIAYEDIVDSVATLEFEDDWGNSGTAVVTFRDDVIDCEFKDVTSDGKTEFGFGNFKTSLMRKVENIQDTVPAVNDTAPSVYIPENETVKYDPSKASGILAAAGLTEQQFRESCTPLVTPFTKYSYNQDVEIDRYHYAYGKQYYDEHPNDPDIAKAMKEWETKDYRYDNLRKNRADVDAYLSRVLYAPKGVRILSDNTLALYEKIKEYPNEFLGKGFVLIGFTVVPDNSNTLVGSLNGISMIINDKRDDVHNPNLIAGKDYYLYVVFDGTYVAQYGRIGLEFSLVSLEKI